MRASIRIGLTAAILVLVAGSAAIAQSPEVTVRVDVAREVVETAPDGSRRVVLEPVESTRPGDVLVYTVHAANVGAAPAVAPRVDDPIPAGTVLIPDSVAVDGPRTRASLDGGRTWVAFPATVDRPDGNGGTVRVPASPESYTHLRWEWDGALAPGSETRLSFKVRVL